MVYAKKDGGFYQVAISVLTKENEKLKKDIGVRGSMIFQLQKENRLLLECVEHFNELDGMGEYGYISAPECLIKLQELKDEINTE